MDKVTLGGRVFHRLSQSTAEHDFWLMAEVRAAGIDTVAVQAGQSSEEMVHAMIDKALASGRVLRLLAGCVIPEGMEAFDWTPQVADETERHLKRLTVKEDKEALLPLVASLLIYFFETGLSSLKISPKSSGVEEPERDEENGAEKSSAGS